jgi:outer membrane protein OmpA-like peptidoglycan-associated protein
MEILMRKLVYLSTACIAICMGFVAVSPGVTHAQETGTMYYYPLTEADYRNNYHAWRKFLEYHLHREQCQHYVEPPAGYVMKGCDIYRVGTAPMVTETTRMTETIVTERTEPSAPFYTIYFDFDESEIRGNERQNLADAAREMQQFNLREVTVSAYTDSAGSDEYNQRLSERRALSVARALASYGIKASVIGQDAYGESYPAVRAADGVRAQENRRVIITYKR